MACQRIRVTRPPRRLSQQYIEEFGDEVKAAWLKRQKRDVLLPAQDEWITFCGVQHSPQCTCGRLADILCDEPMGGGTTCDLPCCEHCARQIGPDVHLCPIHAVRHPHDPQLNLLED